MRAKKKKKKKKKTRQIEFNNHKKTRFRSFGRFLYPIKRCFESIQSREEDQNEKKKALKIVHYFLKKQSKSIALDSIFSVFSTAIPVIFATIFPAVFSTKMGEFSYIKNV
jgi:hypothetical protein